MRKFMDLTGQQFGKLTVEELVGKDKYYDKLWKCRCECGNTVIVRQGHLRSGHSQSCGCEKFHINDLVGQTFGALTVMSRAEDYITPSNGKRYVRWNCECECGNRVTANVGNLRSGSVVSCGCKNPHRFQSLVGKRFGKLVVTELVEPYYNPNGRRLIRYKCHCDCGNDVLELANTLRSGEVLSCGCSVNSKGEKIVSDWLQQHGISYVYHKSFDDCLSNEGYKLNFDFYLEPQNTIVECNGQQHYEPIDFFGGEKRFKVQLEHDKLKKEYAYRHGINYLILDCCRANLKRIESQLSDFLLHC